MRVVVDLRSGAPRGYTTDIAKSLKVTTIDEPGHIAEVQIADQGNGKMTIVVGGERLASRDKYGNMIVEVWPQGQSPETL